MGDRHAVMRKYLNFLAVNIFVGDWRQYGASWWFLKLAETSRDKNCDCCQAAFKTPLARARHERVCGDSENFRMRFTPRTYDCEVGSRYLCVHCAPESPVNTMP